MSQDVETTKDIGTDSSAIALRWIKELELAHNHEQKWRGKAEKVLKRYRDDRGDNDDSTRFNLLFSNTEVLKSVIYSRPPVPDVRRRHLDADPIGKLAAQVLTRSLAHAIDAYGLDDVLRDVRDDTLLPGRGVARVKYVPTFDESGQVTHEETSCEYVDWELFRMSPAKRWDKVRWVAFGELLTRADLKRQFPKVAAKVKLDWKPDGGEETENEFFKRALVWTVWNKIDRKVYVICKGYELGPIETMDDPLRLEGFFPCPRPIYSIKNNHTMVPVPEYLQYQDQADELDAISERITVLVDALRRRGFYDSTATELSKLADADDNTFVPIENLAGLMEKGGLDKIYFELPIEGIAKVLLQLYGQRDQIKQAIYEITGVNDVMRGSSNPNETLGAQQLKNQYGNTRITPRQYEMQRFARDLIRMMGEIISEHFSPQTIIAMTGMKIPEEVFAMLKNDKLRSFRVDIETDSTIQPDADTEQKNRIELLTAITAFFEKVGPAVQAGTMPIDVAKELLMFGVRAFKVGPQLEETLEGLGKQQQESPEVGQLKQQMEEMQQALQDAQAKVAEAEKGKIQNEIERTGNQKRDEITKQAIALDQEKRDFDYEKKIFDMTKRLDVFQTGETDKSTKARETTVSSAQQEVQLIAETVQSLGESLAMAIENMQQGFQAVNESVTSIADQMQEMAMERMKPISIGRDKQGRAMSIGDRQVQRDQAGRMIGF